MSAESVCVCLCRGGKRREEREREREERERKWTAPFAHALRWPITPWRTLDLQANCSASERERERERGFVVYMSVFVWAVDDRGISGCMLVFDAPACVLRV